MEEAADFQLTIQSTDTLIGISNRLLIEPNRWPELQKRNNIADPRRLVPGSTLVIPRALLRVDPAEITLLEVIKLVDGADTFDYCVLGMRECSGENPCPLHALWLKSKVPLLKSLNKTTLADLIAATSRRAEAVAKKGG